MPAHLNTSSSPSLSLCLALHARRPSDCPPARPPPPAAGPLPSFRLPASGCLGLSPTTALVHPAGAGFANRFPCRRLAPARPRVASPACCRPPARPSLALVHHTLIRTLACTPACLPARSHARPRARSRTRSRTRAAAPPRHPRPSPPPPSPRAPTPEAAAAAAAALGPPRAARSSGPPGPRRRARAEARRPGRPRTRPPPPPRPPRGRRLLQPHHLAPRGPPLAARRHGPVHHPHLQGLLLAPPHPALPCPAPPSARGATDYVHWADPHRLPRSSATSKRARISVCPLARLGSQPPLPSPTFLTSSLQPSPWPVATLTSATSRPSLLGPTRHPMSLAFSRYGARSAACLPARLLTLWVVCHPLQQRCGWRLASSRPRRRSLTACRLPLESAQCAVRDDKRRLVPLQPQHLCQRQNLPVSHDSANERPLSLRDANPSPGPS